MTFIETLKNMSKLQMPRWKKSKSKMNLPGKIVRNADHPWSSNWVATENSWLVPISRIAAIRKPSSNRLALLAHRVKKDKLSNGKVRRNGFSIGCDRYPECEYVSWDKPVSRPCPKCESTLVEKKSEKRCTDPMYRM